MNIFQAIFILTLLKPRAISTLRDDDNEKKCSNKFCLPLDYNKLDAPFKDSEPLVIYLLLDGFHILEFDDIRFTVKLLLYLSVIWEDYRIIGPPDIDPTESCPVDIGFANNLWIPDIYIYNVIEHQVSNFNFPFAGKTSNMFGFTFYV